MLLFNSYLFAMNPRVLLTVTGIACCMISAIAQPFAIGQQTLTLTDNTRSNRQIPVEIFYPATTAGIGTPVAGSAGIQFPVIAFGHGFSMTFDAYSNFWNELVPQGYILIFPKTETGPIPFPSHTEFALDLSFAVSYMQSQGINSLSLFNGKISGKTALMGHSMGGGCSFLAGANSAITTVIGFAPAETNPSSITAASNVSAPTLIFWGSKDNVTPAAGNAAGIYNAVGTSCKAYITVTDASHCGFAESSFLCEFGESTSCIGCSFIPRAQQHATTFQLLKPWLRFYLKGECGQWDVFNMLANSASGITAQQNCNYQLPVADVTASGSTSFCVGGSVTLIASGNYYFTWSTGDNSASIMATQSGNYVVTVNDSYDCKDTSAVITLDVYSNPHPSLLATNRLIFCENESTTLFTQQSFSSYLWSDGGTDSMLIPTVSGDYFVQVIDNSGCSGVSDTVSVLVNTVPVTPALNFTGDTLFVSTDSSYSINWYLDDSLIAGANTGFFVPVTNGEYHVVVTDSNGCSATSPNIMVLLTGVEAIREEILLFPNPTTGKVFMSEKAKQVMVYDAFTELRGVYSDQTIDLRDLPQGVYFLEIHVRDDKKYFQFVLKF